MTLFLDEANAKSDIITYVVGIWYGNNYIKIHLGKMNKKYTAPERWNNNDNNNNYNNYNYN